MNQSQITHIQKLKSLSALTIRDLKMGAKSKCPKFWKTKQKISIKLLKQINQRGEKFVPDEKLTKEKTKNNLRNQLQLISISISISQGVERERECVLKNMERARRKETVYIVRDRLGAKGN